jgi:hypothetical protein
MPPVSNSPPPSLDTATSTWPACILNMGERQRISVDDTNVAVVVGEDESPYLQTVVPS